MAPLNHPVDADDYCAQTASVARSLITNGELDLSPGVRAMLLDVTDGKLTAVETDIGRMRTDLNAKQLSRWLDWALFVAAYNDHARIAEYLIKQGANVNAHPLQPTFDNGRKFAPERMWPPLQQAADCGNTEVLEVLLDHHADMYASIREPFRMPGPLFLGVIGRHEDTVRVLLDHGYDPCLMFANYYPNPRGAGGLAQRADLSPALVKRLTVRSDRCSAKASPLPDH